MTPGRVVFRPADHFLFAFSHVPLSHQLRYTGGRLLLRGYKFRFLFIFRAVVRDTTHKPVITVVESWMHRAHILRVKVFIPAPFEIINCKKGKEPFLLLDTPENFTFFRICQTKNTSNMPRLQAMVLLMAKE